ncbi:MULTISPECIES: hypothetical protein [Enterococcus]|uniref:hypothetical protein n=1 Tax=Enterococcus TaxID=1350 RepID=UPI0007640488|nr:MULTISPECIES: hypothetical protein [Enterococcus]MBK0039364.1 hypothetical protein [Enterococcus sp. S52]MBK0072021.1 hypothetical protein [Enterococcus sp. S53]MBK0142612.1 hypothetical protein [Enterococcus sp. S76]MBK0146231.1 hypothetical protein [Enterococcus sp. S77]QQU24753.1 hypothetical protein I6I77_16890 [Enterococcus casseliflavus]
MKAFKKIIFTLVGLCFIIPTVSATASSIENDIANQPDITIVDALTTRAAKKEAVVKNTAQQKKTDTGVWSALYNITYKSIWFTNGVTQTGYRTIKEAYFPSHIEYTFAYDYRVY